MNAIEPRSARMLGINGSLKCLVKCGGNSRAGKATPLACKEAGVTEQTYYRWRKEYGGLKVDQAKRLKDLEQENGKLKRLVAELSLDKQILQDIARGNF
jgi:transposase-like protein